MVRAQCSFVELPYRQREGIQLPVPVLRLFSAHSANSLFEGAVKSLHKSIGHGMTGRCGQLPKRK